MSGVVHQAESTEDQHSLHLTLSTYQLFDWAQYMQKLVPLALQNAIEEDADFRAGLPIHSLDHVGLSKAEKNAAQRDKFIRTAKRLLSKLVRGMRGERWVQGKGGLSVSVSVSVSVCVCVCVFGGLEPHLGPTPG